MKNLRGLFVLLALLVSVSIVAKPKIRIIATGGTIAGVSQSATSSAYSAGQVGVQTLIDAVPQMLYLADISGEQLVNIGSQDMNDEVWLKLAKRINQLLNEEGYDGVVVTHGTDTMEETAYFLNLTVKSDKPVILVGSMRPSTGISADGPGNLYAGVAAAASPKSKGRGVMCCMNNLLLDAKDVVKMHTTDVATFQGANYGKVGYVYNGEPIYNRVIQNKHTTQSVFDVSNLDKLPKVGIVYGYANCSPLPMQAFVDAKFAGIVLASQSVRDYMPEGDFSGADKIRILFELCQYKFMFKQDSSAKEHIRRIFGEGMTFSQVESIPFLEQGENVLSIAGAGALQFRVWLSKDYEATLFSGGR